jgi:hypothetical protein
MSKQEFDVDLAVTLANDLLKNVHPEASRVQDLDLNLMRAVIIQKLVGAASAWKATKMTDMATAGLSELMDEGALKSAATSHGHSTAHLSGQDEEDEEDGVRNLEDLKMRLNLNKKKDKRR